MPQTEEEHLENQNLDYEDLDKAHPDAEVNTICQIFFYLKVVFRKNYYTIYSGYQSQWGYSQCSCPMKIWMSFIQNRVLN